MDEGTLTRLKKYDDYLAQGIELAKSRVAKAKDIFERGLYEEGRSSLLSAQERLHELFPELRAPEGQLAEKAKESTRDEKDNFICERCGEPAIRFGVGYKCHSCGHSIGLS